MERVWSRPGARENCKGPGEPLDNDYFSAYEGGVGLRHVAGKRFRRCLATTSDRFKWVLPTLVSCPTLLFEVITNCCPMVPEKPIVIALAPVANFAIITSVRHRKGRPSSFSGFHLLRRKRVRQQHQQQGGLLFREVGTKEFSHESESQPTLYSMIM